MTRSTDATDAALSIATTYYQSLKMDAVAWNSIVTRLGVPYYSISVSLNILLTLMIATRLIRHSRNLRSSIGPATDGGLYNTVVTMLVESCALYAVASLLFIGTLGGQSKIQGVFAPIFVNIQVRLFYYSLSHTVILRTKPSDHG